MYKILLDENIPMEVYNYFQSLYEVDKVGIDYPYGISDEEIINILNTCKYQIFVTYDKDF
jgi:predicted nuclease of predicted toxin-antitoxin system